MIVRTPKFLIEAYARESDKTPIYTFIKYNEYDAANLAEVLIDGEEVACVLVIDQLTDVILNEYSKCNG